MDVVKRCVSRVLVDYREADTQVELVPRSRLDLEVMNIGDVAGHRCRFFAPDMKWCGKSGCGEGVTHDPERVHGLVEIRLSKTGGEPM